MILPNRECPQTIAAPDILAVLRRIEAKGNYKTARRVLQLAGRVFRYAVVTARLGSDPSRDLRAAPTAPTPKHYGAIIGAKRAGELLGAIDGYEELGANVGEPIGRTAWRRAFPSVPKVPSIVLPCHEIMAPASNIIACPACATLNRVPASKLGSGGKCGRCGHVLFDGHPVALNSHNFDVHASKSDIPLLVDFWAPWCGPCRQMAPAFEAAATRLEPRVRLGKLDTEHEQGLAARFGIRSIPTLALLYHGREIARQSGVMPLAGIVAWVQQRLAPNSDAPLK